MQPIQRGMGNGTTKSRYFWYACVCGGVVSVCVCCGGGSECVCVLWGGGSVCVCVWILDYIDSHLL